MRGYLDTPGVVARLRAARQARELSAQKVSDLTGIPRPVLSNMENGRRESLPYSDLLAICGALGLAPCDVIRDEPLDLVVHLATV